MKERRIDISLRLTESVFEELEAIAEQDGSPVSTVARRLMLAGLRVEKQQQRVLDAALSDAVEPAGTTSP